MICKQKWHCSYIGWKKTWVIIEQITMELIQHQENIWQKPSFSALRLNLTLYLEIDNKQFVCLLIHNLVLIIWSKEWYVLHDQYQLIKMLFCPEKLWWF